MMWHIWRVDKEGRLKEWVGFIRDPGTAFQWFKSRDLDPKEFRVNNVPPDTSTKPLPDREVYALDAKRVREVLGTPVRPFSQREGAKKPARTERRRPAAQAPVAPARRKAEPESAEMRGMKKSAKELLDQHKADEAAELEQEKRNKKS